MESIDSNSKLKISKMKSYFKEKTFDAAQNYKFIMESEEILNNTLIIAEKCIACFEKGGKLLLAGNGGSAADAQHLAGEFVGRFEKNRKGLNAFDLNSNNAVITAIGNDISHEDIFSRQVEALGKENDIFFAYSTSGNSNNILKAIEMAKSKNILTIGFTGNREGKINNLCDYLIKIPNANTARIQEGHHLIGHIICGIVENSFFK